MPLDPFKDAFQKAEGERTSNDDGRSVFLDHEVEPQIRWVIESATESVTLVTPYLRLWEHLKTGVEDAINRRVGVSFIVRADEKFQPEDLEWLHQHHVRVIKVPNLHAKIYLNERTVLLVSSMNITRTSTMDSRDFAMIVKSEDDAKMSRQYVSRLVEKFGPTPPVYLAGQQAVKYATTLVQKLSSSQYEHSGASQSERPGTCIRCGNRVNFDKGRSLCDDCYRKWARYKDEDYAEKHCHSCGKLVETTYARPLCLACWKKKKN